MNTFFGTGGLPELNLANVCDCPNSFISTGLIIDFEQQICNDVDNATFSGTKLAECTSLATDIEFCQAQGKVLTLSIGGAGGSVGFTDDSEGEAFATTIWNLFLGGSSDTRPFGSAVLDG